MKKLLGIVVLGLLLLVNRANANLIKHENCFTKDYFNSDEYNQPLKEQNRIIINDPYVSQSTIEFFKKPSVEKVWCKNVE